MASMRQKTSCILAFCSGSKLCTSFGSISQVFLLMQNSLCLDGLQACCTIRSCHFSALSACSTSTGQAWKHFSCITGWDAQQSQFLKAKSMLVTSMCHTFKNTPKNHASLQSHCGQSWSSFLRFPLFEKQGPIGLVLLLLHFVALWLAFVRLQEIYFPSETEEWISLLLATSPCVNANEYQLWNRFRKK